jgi:hypothetical protein
LQDLLLARRNVSKRFWPQAEILRNSGLWDMIEPTCEMESRVFRNVTVVEDGKEFRAFEDGRWRSTKIASLEVIDVDAAVGIERCDPDSTFQDMRPFSFLILMKLSHDSFLLGACSSRQV